MVEDVTEVHNTEEVSHTSPFFLLTDNRPARLDNRYQGAADRRAILLGKPSAQLNVSEGRLLLGLTTFLEYSSLI